MKINDQFYGQGNRQMILADLIEYIVFGRGYYALDVKGTGKDDRRKQFIAAVLHLVNILMSADAMCADKRLRDSFLDQLESRLPSVKGEMEFERLKAHVDLVGVSGQPAPREIDDYYDSLLPKTAGGLWHELVSYLFLLRSDVGYIVPLLLTQRFMGRSSHLVPPDFLVIGKDKRIYGIEVGRKKEIQSGGFSLSTGLPTATLDTENSRISDRCPICHNWIQICPYVIESFSDLNAEIQKIEIKCMKESKIFAPDQIARGYCAYSKYSRKRVKSKDHTHHDYADGKHYHYRCVLSHVPVEAAKKITLAMDEIAVKTHYPYYGGLEALMSSIPIAGNSTEAEAATEEQSTTQRPPDFELTRRPT